MSVIRYRYFKQRHALHIKLQNYLKNMHLALEDMQRSSSRTLSVRQQDVQHLCAEDEEA
jgi:DNA-binding transcriptional MerR regulator